MRELCGVSSGGDVSDKSNSKNMLVKSGTPGIKMSPTPGYLELSPEKMEALISQSPIEDLYEVEDQPFARGKYAAVRRCRHRESGQQFAAKFLKKSRRSADLRPEIIHEVAILDACAGSSRIVRLQQVFESAHEMVLLLELAPGGELQMLLDNDEVPEEVQVKKLMKQILDGLIFLHSINVAHLDLKPQNLVLTGDFPHCDVKLCDLGISRYISEGADIRDILGTPDYVAPEVLNYESISLATDMWSVGVLLYVLLTGCSPFGGDSKQETFCNISQCNLDFPDDLFDEISEDAIDLMKKLMVKDPSKRLDARQCLQHRWFSTNEGPRLPGVSKAALMTASPLPARKADGCVALVASPKLKHKAPVETTVGEKGGDLRVAGDLRIQDLRIAKPAGDLRIQELRGHDLRVTKPAGDLRTQDLCGQDLRIAKPAGDLRVPEIHIVRPVGDLRTQDLRVPEIHIARPVGDLRTQDVRVPDSSPPTRPTDAGIKPARRDNLKRNLSELAQRVMETDESLEVTVPASESSPMRRAVSMHHLAPDPSEVVRRYPRAQPDLYSFRRCVVVVDADEETSPPPSIAGSVTSSLYSDQSVSDSGSDRSSIVSLDDGLDYRPGRYAPSPSSAPHHNVWSKRASLGVNDAFASAFMRFSAGVGGTRAPSRGRAPARGAHTVVLDRAPPPSRSGPPACRVEFRKERYGNVVVIREVRAGKYLQVNELKCDSIQARIRRLQVQGIQKT